MRFNIIFFLLFFPAISFATISGTGCKIGRDYVYTEYLGMASPYHPSNPKIRYYRSTGPKVPIYWGEGHNQYQGYRCGYINIYPASSYYDAEQGKNVPIPAENEITSYLSGGCVIAPSLGATPVSQDTYVAYSYNRTGMCTVKPPNNIPLDDYIWLMLVVAGGLGFFFLKGRGLS